MPSTSLPETRRALGSGAVTLKEIAAHAGVSAMTASVVLNGARPGTAVADATRERVLLAADKLGYRRNGSAQAFRTGYFGAVSLLLSTNHNHSGLPQRLWDGIHDELAARDMTLSMARLPDEKLTDEGVVPRMLREWMADGLLIDYTNHIPSRMIELIHKHNLPAVWINAQQESDCVYPDDRAAATRMTRHLLKLGHKRVLYLDFIHVPDDAHEHYSYRDRIVGYQAAMQKAACKPRIEPAVWMPLGERVAHLKALLQGPKRPTAILTYGDLETDLVAAVAAELGLRVPRDLSLASFGAAGARYPGLAMTLCVVPEYEVGQGAVRMLLQKIENPARGLTPQVLQFAFDKGETCAPPSEKYA